MAFKQVSYGARGEDVKTLQERLNSNGYKLDVDGNFGPKTQAAVKDYQKKNKLTVDGIVGNNTWGTLTKEQSNTQAPQQAATAGTGTQAQKMPSYDAGSDAAYQQALAALRQAQNTMPSYQATYDAQLEEIYDKIVNRDKFKYDLNGDALYQQYADQYRLNGQMAMMDTMGQAQTMTGGYGNSYAQSVGQQAYQGYLQQLNEVVPELYGMAQDQYNQEGQALYDQFALTGQLADTEYGRYQDALNQHWQNLTYADQQADEAYDRGYGEYMDNLNYQYQLDRDAVEDQRYAQEFGYQQERDKIADSQWEKEFAEAQRQYDKSYQLSAGKASGSGGSSSGKGTSGSGSSGGSSGNGSSGGSSGSASDGTSGSDSSGGNKKTGVTDSIKNKASGYTSNTDLANYLDGLTSSGVITEDEADDLYAQYKQVDKAALNKRDWKLVDDGGVNWFWGIDNNAKVKDQYGNTYSLDKLVDALVADGMSQKEAKAYVKKLQGTLGA